MPSYVVTGASRGLGSEFIRQLSKDPANTVIGLVRNKSTTVERMNTELNHPKNVHILQADVNDYAALKASVDDVVKITGGSLDVLVGNAGIAPGFSALDPLGALADNPEALEKDLLDAFKTNVISNVHLFNFYMPLILKGTTKKVIAISTGMADMDVINKYSIDSGAPYGISKVALNMLVVKTAAQYKKDGVLVMSICPGTVATDMNTAPPPEAMPKVMALMSKLAEYAPHFQGPVPAEESVRDVIAVINKSSIDGGQSGAFLSHLGTKQWL